MELFVVYIRSMCTYSNKSLPDTIKYVDYKPSVDKYLEIAYFNSFDESYNWLIKNGKKLTKQFYDNFEEGCAFVIRKKNKILQIDLLDEDYVNLTDLYLLDRSIFHYVFSDDSYKMCLTEHALYYYNDWDEN